MSGRPHLVSIETVNLSTFGNCQSVKCQICQLSIINHSAHSLLVPTPTPQPASPTPNPTEGFLSFGASSLLGCSGLGGCPAAQQLDRDRPLGMPVRSAWRLGLIRMRWVRVWCCCLGKVGMFWGTRFWNGDLDAGIWNWEEMRGGIWVEGLGFSRVGAVAGCGLKVWRRLLRDSMSSWFPQDEYSTYNSTEAAARRRRLIYSTATREDQRRQTPTPADHLPHSRQRHLVSCF